MEVRTARRQHQLRPEATNMRVTTHESENGCYYWFQLAVTARVSLRSTPEATQCRCHGVGWRRHRYDHNQPLQIAETRLLSLATACEGHAPQLDEKFLCPAERIRSRFPDPGFPLDLALPFCFTEKFIIGCSLAHYLLRSHPSLSCSGEVPE